MALNYSRHLALALVNVANSVFSNDLFNRLIIRRIDMETLDRLSVDRNDVVFLYYVGPKRSRTNCYKGISYDAYVKRIELVKDELEYPSKQWPLVIISHGQL